MTAWNGLEERVRAFAKVNHIGPHELARRLGYDVKSRSWGSNFMSGRKGLPADRLEMVAALMGKTIAALFEESDSAEPSPAGSSPNLAQQMAWEFRRAAKRSRRATAQALLRDIAWSLEPSGPADSRAETPAKRRRARA